MVRLLSLAPKVRLKRLTEPPPVTTTSLPIYSTLSSRTAWAGAALARTRRVVTRSPVVPQWMILKFMRTDLCGFFLRTKSTF